MILETLQKWNQCFYSSFFKKFKPVDDLLWLKYKEKYPEVRFSIAPEDEYKVAVAMPEKIKDIGKNIAFAGIDDQTGDIYVIEINLVVKNKFNQIRSVFKTNARQYEKYKLGNRKI